MNWKARHAFSSATPEHQVRAVESSFQAGHTEWRGQAGVVEETGYVLRRAQDAILTPFYLHFNAILTHRTRSSTLSTP